MTIDSDLIALRGGIATHVDVVVPARADALRRQLDHSPFLARLDMAERLRHVQHVDHVGSVGLVGAACAAHDT